MICADSKMTVMAEPDCRETSGRRYRWTDLSVLILSLLLAVAVGTVVYMTVRPPVPTCVDKSVQQQQPSATHQSMEFDVDVEVDGKKNAEKITYNENRNVALFYNSSGSFSAEDYDKGWIVTNLAASNECVVIPTGNHQDRPSARSIMSGYANSGVIRAEVDRETNVYAQLLPGSIEDRSMFSDEVNQVCSGGYKWLTTVDIDDENAFEVGERKKRAIANCVCTVKLYYSYTNSRNIFRFRLFELCLPYCYSSRCTKYYLCNK